jgi:hypothetical protein
MIDHDKLPPECQGLAESLKQGIAGWSDQLNAFVIRAPYLSEKVILMSGDMFDSCFLTEGEVDGQEEATPEQPSQGLPG